MREDIQRIWEAALDAAMPDRLISKTLSWDGRTVQYRDQLVWTVNESDVIYIFSFGKAACEMVESLSRLFTGRTLKGMIITKKGHGRSIDGFRVLEAAHPIPDYQSVQAAKAVIAWINEEVPPESPMIVTISGGGSSLFCLPDQGVSLEDKIQTNQLLLSCGADIKEINCVRKHLSAVKGGRFSRLLGRRPVLSLILSDVVGDYLDAIASGPTVPDPTTFDDALHVFKKYGLIKHAPKPVLERLEKGKQGEYPETVKTNKQYSGNEMNRGEAAESHSLTPLNDPVLVRPFPNQSVLVIGNNFHACKAAVDEAKKMDYSSHFLSSSLEGDTMECAHYHQAVAREIVTRGHLKTPTCIVSGGETTVRLRGDGLGGRNQEFVLCWIEALEHWGVPIVVASLGTDGTDGPTDAAGAIADNRTMSRARARQMSPGAYLHRNDSYHFFSSLNDLIMTGPTGTNVMDIHIILIGTGNA